jgi:hypothetical protein
MTDTRRLGHAQRRRVGAPANLYGDTMQQPSFGVGDTVKAKGRYRSQTVTAIQAGVNRPDGTSDGHLYEVTGGKSGRVTVHPSGELSSFELGTEELQ